MNVATFVANLKGIMFNHPWAPALLALTQLSHDALTDQEARDALIEESIVPADLTRIVGALESICDCTFRA